VSFGLSCYDKTVGRAKFQHEVGEAVAGIICSGRKMASVIPRVWGLHSRSGSQAKRSCENYPLI
jgi:hypothetical protein